MNPDWLAAFLVGFLGAGHCMGMCGGIASLMNIGQVKPSHTWLNPLCYNIGRLLSYSLTGAIIGASVSSITNFSGLNASLLWLRILSALFMLALALYIGQWWQGLLVIEKAGQKIWQYISPIGQKLLPITHPIQAIPFGFIWGWLPCGMVYSMLTWSAAAGDSLNGAMLMFAFGLGTLPAMLFIAIGASSLNQWVKCLMFRRIGASLLAAYGIFQLYQAVVRLL